jgi:hypothetical protein
MTMALLTKRVVGSAFMLASGVSSAQDGHMMNSGGMWGGGMGGYWGILLVVVVGVVVWAILNKRK